jgi:hypothetical protein
MQEKAMAETKDRRKTPRKAAPKTEGKAAPRKTVAEERSVALDTSASTLETARKAGKSGEEVRRLIEEAAYYRAMQRGFEPGHEIEDWIQAESEVAARLNNRQ